MEGVQCAQCGCHDFLPFNCIVCEQSFCLEHRSRFAHNPCSVHTNATAGDF
jgi:predicted nucleic acid binding AN1-type Zn finger protein